jgi:hypothetical protein
MYLHLGGQVVVPFDSVIGVFDLDTTTTSKNTRKYLERAETEGNIVSVSDELPRSFVVCEEKEKTTVYLSQISAQTLLKRTDIQAVLPEGKDNII